MQNDISKYINNYLSPYLCGFRKGYSTETCLMAMLECWKKALDKNKIAGAILTDLSKAFDCINHELLIAKLAAYGFDHNSLSFIYSYLSKRKQRTKVNNTFSSWSQIIAGVPQGSILGPLLFNIYINDLFYFIQYSKIANYADDNTPYYIEEKVEILIKVVETDTSILIKWFKNNYFKINTDKCKLIITNQEQGIFAKVGNDVIECSKSIKLLGITIDNKLNFNEHALKICKKASQKLHALARISNYISTDKLKLIMNAFIDSQFSYCPLIWMNHSRTINNRINRLHRRALRIVYKEPDNSFEELLTKNGSFSIHHKNLQKLATEMYKNLNNYSPKISKMIFQLSENTYNLRNKNPFQLPRVISVNNGTETISYRGPRTWDLVPNNIKTSKNLSEFKTKIKEWKPVGCKCRLCKEYISDLGFL